MPNHHSLPHVLPEMLNPDFWINQLSNPSVILLTPLEIQAFNQAVRQRLPGKVMDLTEYPREINGNVLYTWLNEIPFSPKLYDACGSPLSAAIIEELKENINSENLPERIAIRYGATVRHTELRVFPTMQPVFTAPSDTRFDQWQATAVNPGEPLLILHQSLDGQWCYIQTGYYRGWIPAKYLTYFPSRSQWLGYLNHSPFLTVTGPGLRLTLPSESEHKTLLFEMGAKIRVQTIPGNFQTYLGFIPAQGNRMPLTFPITSSPDLTVGYLPYTETNLLTQAFKMVGQPYGWGGHDLHPDCSSFTRNLYRCFGFELPRDSGEQAQCSLKTVPLRNLPSGQKNKVLSTLPVGTLLHLNGHIMIYLGLSGQRHYVIHALSGYQKWARNVYLMAVTVSDLSLRRLNGQTLFNALTSAIILR